MEEAGEQLAIHPAFPLQRCADSSHEPVTASRECPCCHPYRVNLIPSGRRRFNEVAGTNLDRLAGISDGIFAVGMTLLVLGLALPTLSAVRTEADLWQALLRLGPSVLVYTMSVMTLGIFSVGQ